MASREAKGFFHELGLIVESGSVSGLSDTELLGRFAGHRGPSAEAAFESIINKHGPMVFRVCRSILRHTNDADDAFQATFLVLASKANQVRVDDSLGPWLYGVARRIAGKARSVDRRRRIKEASIESAAATPIVEDIEILDDRQVIFEELDRLPQKYRAPIVLCHLEGLSHEEAARQLR